MTHPKDLNQLLDEAVAKATKEEQRRQKYEDQRWDYLRKRKTWKARKKKFNDWRNRHRGTV